MRIVTLLSFLLLIGACEKDSNFLYEDLTPPRQERNNRYVIEDLAKNSSVDVLFVIDNSGSMGWIQDNIVKNAALFMEEFLTFGAVQWKMGLISTDNRRSVNEVSKFLGFDEPFTRTSPNPVTTFEDAVDSLGTSGSGSERIFYNIDRVLRARADFLSKKSSLAIIMVTDEVEQSASEDRARYEPLTFVQIMKNFVSKGNLVRFYGALQMRDFPKCTNWNGGGQYGPYRGSRYEAVVQETGGFTISACAEDFGTKLAEIGKDIVSLANYTRITLGERPLKESIKVTYKGEELAFGTERDGGKWFYDEYNNTVNLYTLQFADDLKDEIEVSYEIDDGYSRPRP